MLSWRNRFTQIGRFEADSICVALVALCAGPFC